jgi:hypothetical protein
MSTSEPDGICVLAEPMEELLGYHKVSKEAGWHEEGESTVTKMKALVRRLIGVLVEKDEKHNAAKWSKSAVPPNSVQWSDLSPLDWTMIWRSILLLSYDKYFCQVFGKEKILMESLAQRSSAIWIDLASLSLDTCSSCFKTTTAVTGGKRCKHCMIVFMKVLPGNGSLCISCRNYLLSGGRCRSCSFYYKQVVDGLKGLEKPFYYNGKPVPANPDAVYKSVVHVDVPESLANPKHFGHLAWKFCEFMTSLEGAD